MDFLKTKHVDDLNTESAHSYHPRPSFKRDLFLSLNGRWDLAITREGEDAVYDRTVIVPFAPEAPLSGIGERIPLGAVLHYRRQVDVPEEMTGKRILLHFGAVDQECEVFISGERIGENKGGYLPFSFDVTEYAKAGSFTLEVTSRDTLDVKYPYGKQTDTPHGMWYTPVSGIWQTVWLEAVPKENAVEYIKITPFDTGVKIRVSGGAPTKEIIIEDGKSIFFEGDECIIEPDDLVRWTPETPKLYYFNLKSGEDEIHSYFAVRTVGTVIGDDGIPRLALNGKPYLYNGLLDQGYYPDGLFMPLAADGYLDDIRLAKSLGFNMLRKHIKIEPDVFYYLCDKEGIAVFQDMVNNGDYSFLRDTALPTIGFKGRRDKGLHKDPEGRRIFEETMLKTAELLYNHPSVVYYTIFNEGWGQFSSDEMYGKLKDADGTRTIDSTSGWFKRKRSDVDSRHVYFKRIKAKRPTDKPLVISEFGGYSFRAEGHLFSERNYGYRLFKEREDFEKGFLNLFENEVAPLVDLGASAFVYTQLSDVEEETNGLVTYDRAVVKVDTEKCADVMMGIFKK